MAAFVNFISVDLVLLHLSPYLPVSSLLDLASTSKEVRGIIYETPGVFRHLDLSTCKGASGNFAPIDRGGFNWRNERMDENLTEDDFYSGPLRGVFSKLRQKKILADVQTLVLDRQTVTSDIVHEIICGTEFRVKIMSLLEVQAMNMGKLRQAINYACRGSRPGGIPRIQGLYIFSDAGTYMLSSTTVSSEQTSQGVTASIGAQLGAHVSSRSTNELFNRDSNPFYRSAGGKSMLNRALGWESTLNYCKDLIAFDAVLCRGPKHDPRTGAMAPAIASVFLGSTGCEQCGKMPEGVAEAGMASTSEAPLLRPPPTYDFRKF